MFEPADGQQARWRHCYELIEGRDVGEHITYEEVMELLDCDRHVALQSMRTANEHREAEGKRSLRTVNNFGWIVESAGGMLRLVEKRETKASRQVKRVVRGIGAIPREELSPFERHALDRKTEALVRLAELHRRRVRIPLGEIGRAAGE